MQIQEHVTSGLKGKDSFPEGENIIVWEWLNKGHDVMCKYALCMAT